MRTQESGRKVALYARISQDRDGDELGVRRQLEDCRAEAARRGWDVAGEYVDDDVSASSFGRGERAEYRRLLADLRAGVVTAVICWHIDRLHRQPLELEEFVKVCTAAGVSDVVTLHGDFNLGTGDGLLVARLLAAVAANESDAKSRRSKRKMRELAEAGKPHGGGPRPFGFQPDRITHDDREAALVREMTARVLAGESLSSICRWLEKEEVSTVRGGTRWRPTTVRGLLLSPRLYGKRTHQGQVVGDGSWEPIISEVDGERLRALLTDPARVTTRPARRYLLSGLCRCAECGAVLISGRSNERRAYLCRRGAGFYGCGSLAIRAELVESYVRDAVLHRLDSTDLADTLTGESAADDGRLIELHEQIAADAARLEELAAAWADGDVSRQEWRVARARIDDRLTANRRLVATLRGHQATAALVGQGAVLAKEWDDMPLTRQVGIVKAVMDHLLVRPATRPGFKGLDLDRVDVVWRT